MSKKCCVLKCEKFHSETRKLHQFPADPNLLREWLKLIRRADLCRKDIKAVRRSYRVCSDHFAADQKFEANRNRTNLKRDAVPSLNLPDSEVTDLPINVSQVDNTGEDVTATTITKIENVKSNLSQIVKVQSGLSKLSPKIVDVRSVAPNATPKRSHVGSESSHTTPIVLDAGTVAPNTTLKIVDVRSLAANINRKISVPRSNNASQAVNFPKTSKIGPSCSSNGEDSVSTASKSQDKVSAPGIVSTKATTFKILMKGLTKDQGSKGGDEDIQIVEADEYDTVDLCDNDSRDAGSEIDLPTVIDSDLSATQDTASSTAAKKDLFSLTPQNLNIICRVCLKEKDVLKLSENNYEAKTYAELLELCSAIKLQEDASLSQNICSDCVEELLQAYQFRQKCSKSEQTLANFKEELAKSEERRQAIAERNKNLTLRFHDYDRTLDEEDVRSITTKPAKRRSSEMGDQDQSNLPAKKYKKRFYLIRGAMMGDQKGLKFKEIDEANAKNLLNPNTVPLKLGDTLCNVSAGVLPPGHSVEDVMQDPKLKNSMVRNINKRKMMAYTQLIRPAINTIINMNRAVLRKKKSKAPPRKRKRNPDKPPKPKDRKVVVPGICEICQEPYNTMEEYKQHAKVTKHYLNPYVCQDCGKIYPDKHRLKVHYDINHEKTKAHMCEKCGKCYSTYNYLFIHMKTHSKTDYVCKVCKASFNTLQEVVRHKKALHKTSDKKTQCCEYCGEFFSRIDTLRHHRNRLHLKLKRQFCQICGRGYQYKSSLKKHMLTHSTLQFDCQLCNKSFKWENRYFKHLKLQHPGTDEHTKEEDEIQAIQCDYCEKVCRNKQLYSVHIREDHEASICIYCDTLFELAEDLDDHIKAQHDEIPDFSCRYCGKCFPESHVLYSHLDNHRTRYYQCNLCYKKFPNTFRLKIHMVYHTGEKLFECQYCDKTFQYSSSRVIHERLHTGERPYVCDICGKGNVCMSSYKRHRRTHTLPQPIKEGVVEGEDVVTENRSDNLELHRALMEIEEVPGNEEIVSVLGN